MSRKFAQNPPPDEPRPEFSRHTLDAIAFARERLGFHPDAEQAIVLDPRIRRGILNCCRQWGKSTTLAARAVWKAYHYRDSLTIVAAPCARQSAEFVRKAGGFLRKLDIRPRGDGDNEISLLLPNGSRIVGLPADGDKTRGFSHVDLLLIDEAARVSDEFYNSLRPMIVANGNAALWLMSTPNGRQGFFYQEWIRPESDWVRIEAPATRCPRISAASLEDERKHLPDQAFRSEYLCEFIAADHAYFDPESVEAAFRRGAANRDESKPDSHFYLGLDLGQVRDYTAIAIAERRVELTGEIDRFNYAKRTVTRIIVSHLERIPLRTPYDQVVDRVRDASQPFKGRSLQIYMDATGVGAAVRDQLRAARLGFTIYGVTITGGEHVTFSYGDIHIPRHDLLSNLLVLLEKNMLEIDVPPEMESLLRTEFLRWGHRSQHDDLIFALALACWKAGGQPTRKPSSPAPSPCTQMPAAKPSRNIPNRARQQAASEDAQSRHYDCGNAALADSRELRAKARIDPLVISLYTQSVGILGKSKKEVLLEFRTSEILAAARQVFAEHGYTSATVDDIADVAGLAKGTVYLYFPSKRDLFLATFRDGVEALHAESSRATERAATAGEKIRAFIEVRLRYCERNRDFFRIYYNEYPSLPVRSSGDRPEFQDLYEQQARLLQGIIEEGIERGEIRPCDARRMARMIYDLTRSSIAQHVLEGDGNNVLESTDMICDLIWRGIAC